MGRGNRWEKERGREEVVEKEQYQVAGSGGAGTF
jgi:hypothetical protein